MKQILDLNTWARKDHFHFFNQFDEPFFGVCVQIDCTNAYAAAKTQGYSFFLYYLYQSLLAANRIPAFRYRIEDDLVWVHDEVHASPTINRPDGSFGFAYIDFKEDFQEFLTSAGTEITNVQQSTGLFPSASGDCVIHYSALPWLDFTSMSHARHFAFKDSSPKISFGKMTVSAGRRSMPVSIHVHHALMDGYHVGQYVELFQQLMNSK